MRTSNLEHRTANRAAARRLLARFWVMARKHRISDAKLAEIVSLEMGRRVVVGSGFGLSRLPVRQLARAVEMNGAFQNAHCGYAVILEELDELWDEIKKPAGLRSREEMVKEARQVGAMALRFMVDLL